VYTGCLINNEKNSCIEIERIKLSRKVLYHFAIFAIINKVSIIKNHWMLVFNNFFKYYQLYRKIARDKNCFFSSHKALRIFSEFFILVLQFSYWQLLLPTWENAVLKKILKKFLEFYEKKIHFLLIILLFPAFFCKFLIVFE